MASQTTTEHENTLRDVFRQMDGDQFQQIRDAYYKAVEAASTGRNTGVRSSTKRSFLRISDRRTLGGL